MRNTVLFGVFRTFLVLVVLSYSYVYLVNSVNTIVTKFEFPSDCIDPDGVTRAHLDYWTTSAGSCDHHVCYDIASDIARFKISQSCDPSVETAIFDTGNCNITSNASMTFPHCCPWVTCSVGILPNNTPAACSDLSPTFACSFWKNETGCMNSSNFKIQHMYNLTLEFCRKTCGYCT